MATRRPGTNATEIDEQALAQGHQSSLVNKHPGDGSLKGKLRRAKDRTKHRAKNLLGASGSPPHTDEEDSADDSEDAALQIVSRDPAFHPTDVKRRLDATHEQHKGPVHRTKAALGAAADAVTHPRQTAKSKAKRKAAGKISSNAQVPAAAHKADVAFLEYERELSKSKSGSSMVSDSDDSEDDESREQKSKKLEQQRDSMRAAWITTRTKRVRVVPKKHLTWPKKSAYEKLDMATGVVKTQWFDWLGRICLYYTQDFATQYVDDFEELPFDLDELRTHVERLVIASGPWQAYIMDLRSLYRWEVPKRTAKYCVIYYFFWHMNHVMTYFWCYILVKVIYNRYYPSSIDSLRAAARRAVDHETAAFQLGEMIDRHGGDNWVDPFLEQVGPYAQVQINDLANFLEVLYNFYAWKSPSKTIASLVFFTSCLIVSLFSDFRFCLKIFWFVSGGVFFAAWPIASLRPKYRLLVSPFKWMFWGVPTHAEWSFQYLRQQAQATRAALIGKRVAEQYASETNSPHLAAYAGHYATPHPSILLDGEPRSHRHHLHDQGDFDTVAVASEGNGPTLRRHLSTSSTYSSSSSSVSSTFSSAASSFLSVSSGSPILPATDLLRFSATWTGVPGRLVIHPSGVRFVRRLKPKELWRADWTELVEMWKVGGSNIRRLTGGPVDMMGLRRGKGRGKLCLQVLSGEEPREVEVEARPGKEKNETEVNVVGERPTRGEDEPLMDSNAEVRGVEGGAFSNVSKPSHSPPLSDNNPKLYAGNAEGQSQTNRGGELGEGWKLKPMKMYALDLKERDEVFNCILGFSGLQWQSLQSEKEKE